MKSKIIVSMFLASTLLLAQIQPTDTTTTNAALIKKYKEIITTMQTSKFERLNQLATADPTYNRYEAVEATMKKLIEELENKKQQVTK